MSKSACRLLMVLIVAGAVSLLVMKHKHVPEVSALNGQRPSEMEDTFPVNTNPVETVSWRISPVLGEDPTAKK